MILDYTDKKYVIYPQKRHYCFFFSLMTREKSIVNNVGWNIPNDNYSRNSHLEETVYTGNKYTPVISE